MAFKLLTPGAQLDDPAVPTPQQARPDDPTAPPTPVAPTPATGQQGGGGFRVIHPGQQLDQPGPGGGQPASTDPPGGALSAFGGGVEHGLGNIWYGGKQLVSHVLPGDWSKDVDKEVQEREAAYQKDPTRVAHPWAATGGNIVGEIAGTLPLDLIPGAGPAALAARFGRFGSAALKGAEIAGIEPEAAGGDDYWTQKAKSTALGAAGGAVGEGVLGSLARGSATADVRRLAGQGAPAGQTVRMTPGQLAADSGIGGAVVRRLEEVGKSLPVLGSFIRSGERQSIEDYNVATINQTLHTIGQRLPAGTEAGHDAIGAMQRAVSAEYDRVLTPLTFAIDPQFERNIGFQFLGQGGGIRLIPGANAINLANGLPRQMRNDFMDILQQRVIYRLNPQNGTMTGRELKLVESDLGNLATSYISRGNAREQQLGQAIRGVQEEIRDALERQNPQAAADLRNVNMAYAMAQRVNDAAGRRGAQEGVFRPTDMLQAIRAGDRTRMKNAFARGDALMQPYATIAQRILPGKMPDSGTPERLVILQAIRHLYDTMGALGTGTAAYSMGHLIPAAATGAAALLPYTRLGQRAIQAFATRNQPGRVAGSIMQYVGDPAAAMLASGQPKPPAMQYQWKGPAQ